EVGDEVVVVRSSTQQAFALAGLTAEIWRAAEHGEWTGATPDEFYVVLDHLIDAGLIVDNPGISRRAVMARSGAVAALAGPAVTGLPEAAEAASADFPFVKTTPGATSVGVPANRAVDVTIVGGGGGGAKSGGRAGGNAGFITAQIAAQPAAYTLNIIVGG